MSLASSSGSSGRCEEEPRAAVSEPTSSFPVCAAVCVVPVLVLGPSTCGFLVFALDLKTRPNHRHSHPFSFGKIVRRKYHTWGSMSGSAVRFQKIGL